MSDPNRKECSYSEKPNSSDIISRRKAFEYFVTLWECIGTIMDRDEWEDVCMTTANEIPSAQPESAERTAETAQNVSDEDLISRKAAMNRIDEALARVFVESRGCGEYILRKLPSVKPERNQGHWVGIDDEPCETWECDKCGCIQECFEDERPNFCPQCGSDMRKSNDGQM